MEDEFTSLPLEYQLRYGTAFRNADLSEFVNNTKSHCIIRTDGSFLTEKLLSHIRSDESALVVDGGDPLVVSPE